VTGENPCAPLEPRVAVLENKVNRQEEWLSSMARDIKAIRSRTDKWSGVVAIVVLSVPALVGGAIGWLLGR
jgi:hypothetical protein